MAESLQGSIAGTTKEKNLDISQSGNNIAVYVTYHLLPGLVASKAKMISRDEVSPSVDVAKKIADALEVSLNYWLAVVIRLLLISRP